MRDGEVILISCKDDKTLKGKLFPMANKTSSIEKDLEDSREIISILIGFPLGLWDVSNIETLKLSEEVIPCLHMFF